MERFDKNYLRFYNDVKEIAPTLFEDGKITLPDTPEERVDFFIKTWYPHMEPVSKAEVNYFLKVNPDVFPGLPFQVLMISSNDKNKEITWEYLHTLFLHSTSIKDVKEKYEDPKIKETLEKMNDLVANMVQWKRDMKSRSQQVPQIDEKFMENSSLSKLVQDITKDINPEELKGLENGINSPGELFEMLMKDDGKSGITNLMKTVTNKLKEKMDSGEVDHDQLFKDANVLLQNMPGMGEGKMPDLSQMMSMVQNLSTLGDLFGQQGAPGKRRQKKKFRKRFKKGLDKAQKKKESERGRKTNKPKKTHQRKSHHSEDQDKGKNDGTQSS